MKKDIQLYYDTKTNPVTVHQIQNYFKRNSIVYTDFRYTADAAIVECVNALNSNFVRELMARGSMLSAPLQEPVLIYRTFPENEYIISIGKTEILSRFS
jgi:ADP-glucose pyrophosphorylase